MKTNAELQKDVQDALKWEPMLHEAEIGVIVSDGIVTLTGIVDTYGKCMEAEQAAKKVAGVRAIVEDIEVRLPDSYLKTDAQVAKSVLDALEATQNVPHQNIEVKVENGWVTLGGTLPWYYQREAARNAVQYLTGVRGIINNIRIKPSLSETVERQQIEDAFRRSGLDGEDIRIEVSDTTILLSGMVNSWYQKDEAESIAWKTPGVHSVINNLIVEFSMVH